MPVAPSPDAPSSEPSPWVVCLCAQWCGTCRDYRPLFEAVARAHPGWRFAWVDIEDDADVAGDFDIETFPTLLVADAEGTRFMGPLLPHAATLARTLAALQAARPSDADVGALLAALEATPERFEVAAGPIVPARDPGDRPRDGATG
jgi:thiol-disulfide isomerase/thioredoxin